MYGPIPDENGLVDLRRYAEKYISNYDTITKIPEENQKYLDSGLKASNMGHMLDGCKLLNTVNLLKINTSNCVDMNGLFFLCNSLTSLDLSNFDTSQVTDMSGMFASCNSLTSLDLSNFDTSQVTDMSYMFNGIGCGTLNLSNFDTSQVTNMNSMFRSTQLTSLDLSNFDTSQVTDTGRMFYISKKLTKFIGILDLSSCTYCEFMFNGNYALEESPHVKNVPRNLNINRLGAIVDNYID